MLNRTISASPGRNWERSVRAHLPPPKKNPPPMMTIRFSPWGSGGQLGGPACQRNARLAAGGEFPLTAARSFTLTRPSGPSRRGGRVVECACLESTCSRKATGGSNPPLSASLRQAYGWQASFRNRRVPLLAEFAEAARRRLGEGGPTMRCIGMHYVYPAAKPEELRVSLRRIHRESEEASRQSQCRAKCVDCSESPLGSRGLFCIPRWEQSARFRAVSEKRLGPNVRQTPFPVSMHSLLALSPASTFAKFC